MRRRSPKVTWFPTFGTPFGEESDKELTGIADTVDVLWTDNAAGALFIWPLTTDQPAGEDPAEPASLADVVGSEYFLRRIVGKLFLQVHTITEPTPWFSTMQIAAGFLVARSDYENPGLPTGASGIALDPANADSWANFSPLAPQTMREPWIWRRKWVLSGSGWDVGGTVGFPSVNINYASSSLDGAHIDAKTRRRVTSDDRLYFALAATAWPIDTPLQVGSTDEAKLTLQLDYRILGSLRKARNRGVF